MPKRQLHKAQRGKVTKGEKWTADVFNSNRAAKWEGEVLDFKKKLTHSSRISCYLFTWLHSPWWWRVHLQLKASISHFPPGLWTLTAKQSKCSLKKRKKKKALICESCQSSHPSSDCNQNKNVYSVSFALRNHCFFLEINRFKKQSTSLFQKCGGSI